MHKSAIAAGFARRCGRAERRKGACPFSCIFFIPTKSPLCLTALCKTPKPAKLQLSPAFGLSILLRASSAHTGSETAQICENAPSVVSLLYLPWKSAEIARICRHPISFYRHPARELPSPGFLPSPASISIVKGFVKLGVSVGSIISTRSRLPFLLSPDLS